MASLIPDIGSISANTSGAMQNYINAVNNTNEALQKPGSLINTFIKDIEEQKRLKQEMDLKIASNHRAEAELGLKQRAEERDISKIAEDRARLLATNNALAVMENPDVATKLNATASQATTQNALNMYNQANADGVVTPQEQALLDSTYKQDLTRDVLTSGSADQKALFDARQSALKTKMQEAENKAQAQFRLQSLQNQAENNRLDAANRAASLKIQQDTLNATNEMKNADNLYKQNERLIKEQEKLNVETLHKAFGGNPQLPYEEKVKYVAKMNESQWINPSTGKVEARPKTEAEIQTAKNKTLEDYNSILESKGFSALADQGDSTGQTVATLQLLNVHPDIVKRGIALQNAENANDMFYDPLTANSFKNDLMRDPRDNSKTISLSDLIVEAQRNPGIFKQVVEPGKGYLEVVEDTMGKPDVLPKLNYPIVMKDGKEYYQTPIGLQPK